MCRPSLCAAFVEKSYYSEPNNKVLNGSPFETRRIGIRAFVIVTIRSFSFLEMFQNQTNFKSAQPSIAFRNW